MPRSDTPPTLRDLYRRPGLMIRRAHQIAVAIFLEECGSSGLTTTQYGVLLILQRRPGIDQNTLARLLGLDRSTTGLVVRKLAERGLVTRPVGARDLRRRELRLTRSGLALLQKTTRDARRAQARLLSPLPAAERERFLDLLERLTAAFNDTTRVPIDYAAGLGEGEAPARRLSRRGARRGPG